jgi:hypothetical protein
MAKRVIPDVFRRRTTSILHPFHTNCERDVTATIMMRPTRGFVFVYIIIIALHTSRAAINDADDDAIVDCPGKDEPFVTTCSGNGNGETEPDADDDRNNNNADFNEEDLVNEVLEDDSERNHPYTAYEDEEPNSPSSASNTANEFCDTSYDKTPMQQLTENINTITKRYYDPLPRNGKAAIGVSLGFIASRICLGVANRVFRLAGATWVLSEMLYTSGFCDEYECVPEEARPWIHILRRTLANQSMKVRAMARRIYDQDRIRELAQRDEFVAAGFASGAFIGFVI